MTWAFWLWIGLSLLGALLLGAAGLVRRTADLRSPTMRRSKARASGSSIISVDLPHRRRRRRLAHRQAPARRRSARKGDDRSGAGGQRRARPQAEDGGRAPRRCATPRPAARRSTICPGISSSARPAPARRRRWSIPACAFRSPSAAGRRRCRHRRHALLRLVVHRQALLIDTAGRYTTQDSDAKVDRRSWLSFLDLLAPQPAAPADQRRPRRDLHRRSSDAVGAGDRRPRRRDPPPARRIARAFAHQLSRLRRLHQDGPDRRLHALFRRSRRGRAQRRVGRDVPDRQQDRQHRRRRSARSSTSWSSASSSACRSACRRSPTRARARPCSACRRSSPRSASRSSSSSTACSSRRAIRRPRRCAASISPPARRRARRSMR